MVAARGRHRGGLACAVAVGNPTLRPLGDVALVVSGRRGRAVVRPRTRREHRRSWRLLAVAPLLPSSVSPWSSAPAGRPLPGRRPALGTDRAPEYLLAIVAVLTLADRSRLHARGLRLRLRLAVRHRLRGRRPPAGRGPGGALGGTGLRRAAGHGRRGPRHVRHRWPPLSPSSGSSRPTGSAWRWCSSPEPSC